jgi:hypothetical protein
MSKNNSHTAHALNNLGFCRMASPHERLMQLVFNALDAKGLARLADGTPRDVFYVEDEVLAEALGEYAQARFAERMASNTDY